ncbi:putative ribonuclease H-like domain-containing protein [Tanacetum coccineum]
MRPFGCPLTILNTLDSLGKFDGKSDEGYLLGYSTSSKAFRVYNKRTKRVEENLHINFLEDQPNVIGTGPNWMFDLDFLTNSMNYIPISVENQINVDAGTHDSYVAGSSGTDKGPTQEYILLPLYPHRTRIPVKDVVQDAQEQPSENASPDKDIQDSKDVINKEEQHQMPEKKATQATSTNQLSTDRPFVSTDRSFVSTDRSNTPNVSTASTSIGAHADESSFVYLGGKIPIAASTLPNADLPIDPNMPDLEDASYTLPNDGIFNGAYDDNEDVGAVADINNIDNIIDFKQEGRFKRLLQHNKPYWVEAMQEELLQFKLQQVWILVDLPFGKKAIGTKWVFRNKRDERSIVVKNKARLVAQGHRQEEGIDYDEVFAPVAIIEAIRLFLAFASYMRFLVYQMDVKSAFLYGTIKEELLEPGMRHPGFVDLAHPNKVYKVVKALYGLHQAPRAWYETLSSFLLENGFRRATTPIESNKPLVKDEAGIEVDGHEYRSMIGSLMYLTASRPDIMFAVCACARFQVTPKASHLHACYAGASLDRKSTNWWRLSFLVEDSYLGSAKSRQLWQILLLRQNMLQLLIAVGKISMDLRMDRCSPGKYYSSMCYREYIFIDAEIYAGLATLGYVTEGDFVPLLPAMLTGAVVDPGEGSAQPVEPHHTLVDPISSTSQPPQSPPHSPPHSSHQSPPHFSPPRSYEAPLPEGNTPGSAKDSMQLKKWMDIVPKLVSRIETLETKLQQIKTTYGKAVCNTPKLGRSGIRVRAMLLLKSITQDIYRTTKKSF